jgi:hypothetical protein
MKLSSLLISVLSAAPFVLSAASARADGACGKFDFSKGVDCRVEVSGGCKADCTPLKFEASCSGGCTVTANATCVDTCGATCVAQCDPAKLDCFAGCHTECDQPTIDTCKKNQPNADCTNVAKAQCDMHCNAACEVPQNNCTEHCHACCTGSCDTQINFDCDYQCFAKLEGGCNVQCEDPKGALFCNGQYIAASDVDACIQELQNKGIAVDVSARGTVTCDVSGCKSAGSANGVACAASPLGPAESDVGTWGLAAFGVALGFAVERRRRQNRAKKG